MENDRPQGRKKRIEGEGSGLYRRGEGLNTGPVGSGEGFKPQQSGKPGFSENEGGGNYNGRRSGGGKSPLLIVVILLILLFGGKSTLSSFLGGGSGGQVEYVQPTPALVITTPRPTPTPAATNPALSNSLLQGILGAAQQSDWKEPENTTAALSQTVADGAREKFTTIRGRNKDVVTIMVYMCGTDLEARGGMATKDLLEMTRATIGDKVNLIVYTGGCTRWNNNVVSTRCNQIYQVVTGNLKVRSSGITAAARSAASAMTSATARRARCPWPGSSRLSRRAA